MKDYLFVLLLSSFRPGVEEEVQCRIIGKEKKEESVVGLYLLISFGRREKDNMELRVWRKSTPV